MTTPDEAINGLRAADQRRQGRVETPDTGPITAERLTEVEAIAHTIRAWNPSIIPGLLQTIRYTLGALALATPALPAEETQRRAHQRAARIDAFLKRWVDGDPVEARFVIGEQAITRPIAAPQAHRRQLRHLLHLVDLDSLSIQVMPEAVTTPGRLGQFALYALRGDAGREGGRLGYVETPVGAWYTTRAQDVARLYAGFDDMTAHALSTDESRTFIQEAL
ncbi:DUF5753 domain-containing protein [Streptantibioticus silvisoli]|uniref:DUF5753 domain-containing protein n=1 Tax=Streptantibioticus silvisoli TaxID=2705255 RepID=A0ABT6W4G2_9ACTN|nr:DUF5753 domain-containing protein [Streptantibioticus silvisoli]MDI5964847.1 DUF5753 domain-containing protein [Streptantibioticus silvisoli]